MAEPATRAPIPRTTRLVLWPMSWTGQDVQQLPPRTLMADTLSLPTGEFSTHLYSEGQTEAVLHSQK